MSVLLYVYLSGIVLMALIGVVMWLMYYDANDKRTGARLLFLAPVWPVLIVPAIRALWADTGWGKQ